MASDPAKRSAVHQKYGGRCAYCGEEITLKQMQVDHVIPKRNHSEKHGCLIVGCQRFEEYGLNDIRNLNPACRPCNNWKSAMTLEATGKPVIFWFEKELQSK